MLGQNQRRDVLLIKVLDYITHIIRAWFLDKLSGNHLAD
jgi:phage-related holin